MVCRKCHNVIDGNDSTCPFCHNQIKEPMPKELKYLIIFGVILLIVLAWFFFMR